MAGFRRNADDERYRASGVPWTALQPAFPEVAGWASPAECKKLAPGTEPVRRAELQSVDATIRIAA